MNVNWNMYRMFYYVAHYGSTSIASKKLYIAQPSVSRGIKQLEENLGCALFARSYHGMELTKSGKLLYDHIGQAVSSIEKAEELLERKQSGNQTTAHVAVIDTTMQFFLLPHLEVFREENPQTYIYIHQCTDVPEAEALMDAKEVDFAIMCEPSEREDLINVPVKEVSDVLVCAAEFQHMVSATQLSVSSLPELPVIMHRRNSASRTLIDQYLHKNGVDIVPKYEFSHVSSILRQIKSEFSLAFILEDTIRNELEGKSLVKIELDPPLPHRYYYLIKPKKIPSQAAYSLVDYLTKLNETK